MCGICGIIYRDSKKVVDGDMLSSMVNTLEHRGPDDEGIFVRNNIGLGHRRLSIIDLSGGHQPIFNEDRTISIVYNGEIYNHEDVREVLIKKGHRYYTKSDTETIVHAYEEYGYECLKHLRGMFAFAIYDQKKKILFLARDRVGKKPLYYYKEDGVFIFASEIKAILKSGIVKKEVNCEMVDFYLSVGYVPGQETLFKNIFKLEPGHYLILHENKDIQIKEYWDINQIRPCDISYKDACLKLKEKLIESVRIRLMSEVPLGVFLSGGLDSSTIVALMSEVVSEPIKTFSVGYKNEPKSSELNYARIIADKFKTEHYEFFLSPDDLFDSIDTFLDYSEEPIIESAGIALFKLAKLAKPKATVLLSGEGADEALAGYQIYPKVKQMETIYQLLKLMPKGLLCRMKHGKKIPEKLIKYLDWVMLPFAQRYRSVSFDVSGTIKEKMYSEQFKETLSNAFDEYYYNLHRKVTEGSLLSKMLYIDTKSWLAEDILLKADRMTMAASIELRAPFLDQEFMELASQLPDSYKLKRSSGKYILKEIVKNILPKEIINRGKKGFPVPLTSWFRGQLQTKAKSLLSEKRTMERGYFNPAYIQGLFAGINRGEDLGRRIFSLVTLELWHRKYID